MTKTTRAKIKSTAADASSPTKTQQVIDLLTRKDGASLEEMSSLANWLPQSTRAFLTGLKKKGYTIASDNAVGVRRYRATLPLANCGSE